MTYAVLAVLTAVIGALLGFHVSQARAWAAERRFFVNSLTSDNVQEFVARQAASTPASEQAEPRQAAPEANKRQAPLGL